MTDETCPLCNMQYDYRVRHALDSDWQFRDDVSVCSRPMGDERVVYVHYDTIPLRSIAATSGTDEPSTLSDMLSF